MQHFFIGFLIGSFGAVVIAKVSYEMGYWNGRVNSKEKEILGEESREYE